MVKKKKVTKRQAAANKEHAAFLASMGYTGKKKKYRVPIPNYKVDTSSLPPLSNSIAAGIAPKRDITTDHLWKQNESPETVAAIQEKAKRVAPAYNKGGTQYITEGANPHELGRKL